MIWDSPKVLFGLWLLPMLAWLLWRSQQRRLAAARRFIDRPMTERLMPAFGGARPWIKLGLLLGAVAALLVAGARPRFGVYYEQMMQRGVDLFVILDVSRSMLAEDVTPNRLERAKSDVKDLLPKLSGDRVGLIAFAGKPVIKVPLTTDHEFFKLVLDEVGPHSAPRGGTLIGDAIRKALSSFEDRRDRDQVLVLITDGGDQDSYPVEAAKLAAERGVKIFTIGLGDPKEGARIPLASEDGGAGFVKQNGQEVWSKMDEKVLQEIALATGGAYIPAQTRSYDLGEVYEEHLANLARGEIRTDTQKRYHDQFQWFVALGLTLLFVDSLISAFPSRRPANGAASPPPSAATTNTDSKAGVG